MVPTVLERVVVIVSSGPSTIEGTAGALQTTEVIRLKATMETLENFMVERFEISRRRYIYNATQRETKNIGVMNAFVSSTWTTKGV